METGTKKIVQEINVMILAGSIFVVVVVVVLCYSKLEFFLHLLPWCCQVAGSCFY